MCASVCVCLRACVCGRIDLATFEALGIEMCRFPASLLLPTNTTCGKRIIILSPSRVPAPRTATDRLHGALINVLCMHTDIRSGDGQNGHLYEDFFLFSYNQFQLNHR